MIIRLNLYVLAKFPIFWQILKIVLKYVTFLAQLEYLYKKILKDFHQKYRVLVFWNPTVLVLLS